MRQLLLWMNHERDVACEYSRLTSPQTKGLQEMGLFERNDSTEIARKEMYIRYQSQANGREGGGGIRGTREEASKVSPW